MNIKKFIPITSDKGTHIKVEVFYTKGGINYFTGTNERRGIYLSISPVKLTIYEGGGRSEGYVAFTGVKQFVTELKRANDKKLNEAAITYLNLDNEVTKNLLNHVCEKNEIVLNNLEFLN